MNKNRIDRLESALADTGCEGCRPHLTFYEERVAADGTRTRTPEEPVLPACTCRPVVGDSGMVTGGNRFRSDGERKPAGGSRNATIGTYPPIWKARPMPSGSPREPTMNASDQDQDDRDYAVLVSKLAPEVQHQVIALIRPTANDKAVSRQDRQAANDRADALERHLGRPQKKKAENVNPVLTHVDHWFTIALSGWLILNKGTTMAEIIAYYRVSTAKQGASGLGLEAQQAAVENYARQTGAEIQAKYVEIESGKDDDRPQLTKAQHMPADQRRVCVSQNWTA